MILRKLVAVWCIWLLLLSVVVSGSSGSDDGLSRVIKYQKIVEEASRQDSAAQESNNAPEGQSQTPRPPAGVKQVGGWPGRPPRQGADVPTLPETEDDEPDASQPSPPNPRPSTPEPPSRPKYEGSGTPAASSPPSRFRFTGDGKRYCDPHLPRWMCDEKIDRDDADETVQKILEWKQARNADRADAPFKPGTETVPSISPSVFLYDANGNLVDDGTLQYQYNSFNQLAAVVDVSTGLVLEEYEYDQDGNRIQKTTYTGGTVTVTHYLDDYSVTVDSDGNVTEQTRIYHEGQLIGLKENGRMRYYHPDHLGSTNAVTNGLGEVVERVDYTPFGTAMTVTVADYLYTGKELDDTGLLYYGARYYQSLHARFTQPDPVIADVYDPQNLNRYAYVLNNPYKYVDPTGNFIDLIADVGFVFFDIYQLVTDPSWENAGALVADVVGALVPFATGGGMVLRAAAKGDNIIDAEKGLQAIDKVDDITKTEKTIGNTKNIKKTLEPGMTGRVNVNELLVTKDINELSQQKIVKYTKMAEQSRPPPINIFQYDNKLLVSNGHHRLEVAKQLGTRKIGYTSVSPEQGLKESGLARYSPTEIMRRIKEINKK